MLHHTTALLVALNLCTVAASAAPLVSDTVTITAKPAGAIHTNPAIDTDGAGVWCAIWTFKDYLSRPEGPDTDVYLTRSLDDGATWSTPAIINSNAATDNNADDGYARIAFDGTDTWLAVWTQITTTPSANRTYASRSEDGGVTWSAAEEIYNKGMGRLELATDRNGTFLITWENSVPDGGSPNQDLLYMRSLDSGDTWSAPAYLNIDAETDPVNKYENAPVLRAAGDGLWFACWMSSLNYVNTRVAFARSEDNGATWSTPAELDYPGPSGADGYPALAVSADGHLAVAWTTGRMWPDTTTEPYADPDIYYTTSSDFGATWSCPAPLSERAAIDDTFPEEGNVSLLADGTGRVTAVWNGWYLGPAQNLYDSEVLFAVSEDHGATWGETLPLNSDYLMETENHAPAIATDAQGVWVTVWGRGGNIPTAQSNAVQAATFITDAPSEGEGLAEGEGLSGACTFEPTLPETGDGEGSPVEGMTEGIVEGTAEGEGVTEGIVEGTTEGEGTPEGGVEGEGVTEGIVEGTQEGLVEGNTEGGSEGLPEGLTEGSEEGSAEGLPEGTVEGDLDGEGALPEGEGPITPGARTTLESFATIDTDGDNVLDMNELTSYYRGDLLAWLNSLDTNGDGRLSVAELLRVSDTRVVHSADTNGNFKLDLSELLRIIQLYNAGGYACAENAGASEDGFEPADGDSGTPACSAHAADMNEDQSIGLSELLRGIQLYNMNGYAYCESGQEDHYCGQTSHL